MILVDRGQKVRFLNFRDFGIYLFIYFSTNVKLPENDNNLGQSRVVTGQESPGYDIQNQLD
jgi:hypothetical protein